MSSGNLPDPSPHSTRLVHITRCFSIKWKTTKMCKGSKKTPTKVNKAVKRSNFFFFAVRSCYTHFSLLPGGVLYLLSFFRTRVVFIVYGFFSIQSERENINVIFLSVILSVLMHTHTLVKLIRWKKMWLFVLLNFVNIYSHKMSSSDSKKSLGNAVE